MDTKRQILWQSTESEYTVHAEVVIEHLEEREAVPGVRQLGLEGGVHVHRKQRPKDLRMLHQQVAEPGKRLQDTHTHTGSMAHIHCGMCKG